MVNAIYIFRFFHNAYFQNKRMDQNGTRKVVEQSKMKEMNNFKEEEEKKEKIQWILVDFKVIRGELGNKPKEFQPVRLFF